MCIIVPLGTALARHIQLRFTSFENFAGFHRFDAAGFVLNSIGSYISPIFGIRGFHPYMVKLCSMHMSNLGALQWVNAGTLLALLERGFFGPVALPLATRLQIVTIRFRKWCTLHRICQTQPMLTTGMLHLNSPQGPELTLKAYHGRVFIQFLTACCQALLDQLGENNDPEMVLLLAVCHGFASWHLRIEALPRYLTREQALELQSMMDETLRVYRLLAARHAGTGSLRFPMRPKLHGLQEICHFMLLTLVNCRFNHTFRDEDAMGFTKRVCKRVHKGLMEVRTLCRLLMRYRSEEDVR